MIKMKKNKKKMILGIDDYVGEELKKNKKKVILGIGIGAHIGTKLIEELKKTKGERND